MADVGCAGILVVDAFCGPMKRLPRAGELLAINQMPSRAGGCAANVAIDLAKQDFAVDVCGCIGNDASAEALLRGLACAGVDCQQIGRVEGHPTSTTVVLLVEGEDRRYIHVFGANAAFEIRQIRSEWIDSLKVLYFGGLLAMPGVRTDDLVDLLKHCRQRKIVTVVDVVVAADPTEADFLERLLPHVDYFLPNDDEAERLTGHLDTERQIETFLSQGVGTVIVTRGSSGAVAATARERWNSGVYHVDSIDPSGSGDAFAAGMITGILRGWELGHSLRYAAALGASATTSIGTTDGVFNASQAEVFLDQHPLAVHSAIRREQHAV